MYTDNIWADHCHPQFLFTLTGKRLQKLLILSHQYVWGCWHFNLHWSIIFL
jgi:hypothetical protein